MRREIINYLRRAKVIIFNHKIDILIFPFVIPLVLLLRVLSPIIKVKLGYFRNQNRFGHFVIDTSYEVCRNKLDKDTKYIYWMDKNVANKEWLSVVEKYITIKNYIRAIEKMNRLIPFGEGCSIRPLIEESHLSRDINGLISSNQPLFKFEKSKIMILNQWLVKNGVFGKKYMCLMIRDSKYLQSIIENDISLDYHNYRDSCINTYKKSVEYLIEAGYVVIRMGRDQYEPLELESDQFIDYAFDESRSDILDVLLPYYSDFCIGTSSGIDSLSEAYGKPSLYLNAMPLNHITPYRNVTWVPKHLLHKECRNKLTLVEILKHQYMDTGKYEENGIEIQDLNEDEILLAVKEFIYHTINGNKYSQNDENEQSLFWGELLSQDYSFLYGYIHPECRVGKDWLNGVLR